MNTKPTSRICLTTILIIGLMAQGCALEIDPSNTVPLRQGRSGAAGDPTWVTVQVSHIQIMDVTDPDGDAEVRVWIVAGDEDPTYSAALVYPAKHNLDVHPGDVIDLSRYGISVDENTLQSGKLYVYFAVVDSDQPDETVNMGIQLITSLLAEGLALAISNGNPAVSFITGFVLNQLGSQVKEKDILGDGLIILEAAHGWGVGKRHTFTSDNDNLKITYRVTRSETSGNPVIDIPTSQPAVVCDGAAPTRLGIGMQARVAYSKVNYRSYPEVPQVWDANILGVLNRGTIVKIIDGPRCAHNGYWWKIQVDWFTQGWMRESLPDKVLLEPAS